MAEQETPPQTTEGFEGNKKVPKTSPLSVHSTYELMREAAIRDPEKTAIILRAFQYPQAGRERTLTPAASQQEKDTHQILMSQVEMHYGALLNGIHQTANLLADLCVEQGDVIALLLPNLWETHLLFWGGQTVGIVCPIPPELSVEQTIVLLSVVKAKVLVAPGPEVSQDLWQKAEEVRRDVESITTVLQVRGPGKERDAVYAFDALLGDYPASHLHIRREIVLDDMAVSLPVRSAAGVVSLVSLTHGDLLYLAWAIGDILTLAPEEVLLRGLLHFIQ